MSTLERTIDPLWYKDAVIYQLHVKSFFDSTGDGFGDFQGLTQKLDYLQSLGITCVWLLPFFPSPLKDDGYDISDYGNVHPSYGTIDDFKAFVDAAHARSIHVLIELVVNHTSDQHPWFQKARHAPPGSPERDFYIWSETDTKFPESGIIFIDTERSNWAYDSVAKQYYWHRFFSHQPDLNHNNPAVVEAVIGVMKFWFELGVDAMRLDAVPFLCVREGTNNENLPETHAVLKRIRRELDATYENRMLLAEANQWPADVRAYFGDGDECHMAFHFPLMPRMFMALRQEDRHAITEILNQTPEIPENCQWAIFLRNHDELTLEMVTDEERDYMYRSYAADPQMRINAGIRRRLAPLVEGSRRQVELLNMLLFSMPGTPIVYYGDEIGMGDNIYLGDRNGVRTPMQWSGDRNGGFSKADTARLCAPAIVDPVYGFQSINVEAQERIPYSLLNWMKRLIALRRQHRVFGRGTMEIIYCANRKVLAYLRRDDQETVLVVANLSRSFQAVELDLRTCAGLTPVEMLGLTELPRIAEDKPYFLTLGPYAAHWFSLVEQPLKIAPRMTDTTAPPALSALDSLPALLVGMNWETIFDSAARQVLERQALVSYLTRQRWFGAKTRTISDVRLSDWAMLRGGSNPAFAAITSVSYTDGWTESYSTPFALVSGEQADRILADTPGLVLAKLAGARKGVIVDAMVDDDVCNRLIDIVQREHRVHSARGTLGGALTAPIDLAGERKWVRGGVDRTNTIAFVNERYALKLFRRIEPGPNPEFEVGRALTMLGFPRIASLSGAVQYDRPGLETGTLAVVQTAITNQGSGWTFTIDELQRYYERVTARIGHREGDLSQPIETTPLAEGTEPPPFFAAMQGWYLAAAATLGRRSAEMHLMLAAAPGESFAPEPLDPDALEAFAGEAISRARGVLVRLESKLEELPDPSRRWAEQLLSAREQLFDRLASAREVRDAGLRTRVHGNYHLGQVLRVEEDFVILGFEGDPARPLNERRAKYSPLRDVASMLRSFDYAAQAALFAFTQSTHGTESQLSTWAEAWRRWVSRAFLAEYRATMAGYALLPAGDAFETLLRALVVDKAISELGYELTSRPDWALIPLEALVTLALPLQR